MKMKSSQLKELSRRSLLGHYGLVILVALFVMALTMLGNEFAGFLFATGSPISSVMREIFNFVIFLVVSVYAAGGEYIYLNLSRKKKAGISQLSYMFAHQPDRVIVVSLMTGILSYICMVPYLIYGYRMDLSSQMLEKVIVVVLLMLLGIVLEMFVTLPFTFAIYLMVDDEELGPIRAVKKSMAMMKGNYGRRIYLEVSFIGLYALSMLTLGIGLLWLIPYAKMSRVKFYQEAIGEIKAPVRQSVTMGRSVKPLIQPAPMRYQYGNPSSQPMEQEYENVTTDATAPMNPGIDDLDGNLTGNDDYNAEA